MQLPGRIGSNASLEGWDFQSNPSNARREIGIVHYNQPWLSFLWTCWRPQAKTTHATGWPSLAVHCLTFARPYNCRRPLSAFLPGGWTAFFYSILSTTNTQSTQNTHTQHNIYPHNNSNAQRCKPFSPSTLWENASMSTPDIGEALKEGRMESGSGSGRWYGFGCRQRDGVNGRDHGYRKQARGFDLGNRQSIQMDRM